jgi:hypothetical protein
VWLTAGCGGAKSAARNQAFSHASLLTQLYVRATSALGHPPKDEQELKEGIKKSNVSLEALKVKNIDDLFTSDRDGKPLVVVYGQRPAGSDVVVYEQEGVDGKRLVGHSIGKVEEVDEAKFKELTAGKAANSK